MDWNQVKNINIERNVNNNEEKAEIGKMEHQNLKKRAGENNNYCSNWSEGSNFCVHIHDEKWYC